MRSVVLGVFGVLLLACGPGSGVAVEPDAGLDDAPAGCRDGLDYIRIDLTGSTPAGPLAPLQYLVAHHLNCGRYVIELLESDACDGVRVGRRLSLYIPYDGPAASTVEGSAELTDPERVLAASPITFEVSHLVPPFTESPPRIAGRVVATGPGWDLDINIDIVSQYAESCTLF